MMLGGGNSGWRPSAGRGRICPGVPDRCATSGAPGTSANRTAMRVIGRDDIGPGTYESAPRSATLVTVATPCGSGYVLVKASPPQEEGEDVSTAPVSLSARDGGRAQRLRPGSRLSQDPQGRPRRRLPRHQDEASLRGGALGRRREFVAGTAAALASPLLAPARPATQAEPFKLSLAEWSFHQALKSNRMDNLDFAETARALNLDAIEYVNQFFMDKAKDQRYLAELNRRASDHGVFQDLIMCDSEGRLGDPNPAKRTQGGG